MVTYLSVSRYSAISGAKRPQTIHFICFVSSRFNHTGDIFLVIFHFYFSPFRSKCSLVFIPLSHCMLSQFNSIFFQVPFLVVRKFVFFRLLFSHSKLMTTAIKRKPSSKGKKFQALQNNQKKNDELLCNNGTLLMPNSFCHSSTIPVLFHFFEIFKKF